LRAVNHSDVHSSFVAVGAGNFTTVTSAESIVSNVDRASFFYQSKTGNTNAPSNSEFSAISGRNPVTNDMIIVTRTDTNPDQSKAYKYGGSSWSEVSNLVSGDMMVDGTIGASKIVADAITSDKIDVSTLSAISANVGTITAGTINGTNMSITNLDAGNITTGDLNANNINLNGTTLTVTANGLQVGTFDGVSHVNPNTIGAVLAAQGTHTFSNTATTGTGTSYSVPELLGGSVITLTIPATKTAETKTYLVQLAVNPVGIASTRQANVGNFIVSGYLYGGANASLAAIGVSDNASYTSDGAINSSPFAQSGSLVSGNWVGTSSVNLYQNAVQVSTMAVGLKFDVTTSTSAATTKYIYIWGGLFGVTIPNMQYSATVFGLFR